MWKLIRFKYQASCYYFCPDKILFQLLGQTPIWGYLKHFLLCWCCYYSLMVKKLGCRWEAEWCPEWDGPRSSAQMSQSGKYSSLLSPPHFTCPSQPHQQLCSPNSCSKPNKLSVTKGGRLCVLVCVRCLFSLSRVLNTCFTCASGEPWSQALHSVPTHFSGEEPVHHI